MDGGLAVTAGAVAASRADLRPWALSTEELIGQLDLWQAIITLATSATLALTREIDGRGVAAEQGATSTAVWLRNQLRIGTATRMVTLAKTLDTNLPATDQALAEATLNPEQAQVIADAIQTLPSQAGPSIIAQAESMLVEHADRLDPAGLKTAGTRILTHIAPDLADEHERQQLENADRNAFQRRSLTLTPDRHGGVRLRGLLDQEAAAIVAAAIDPLSTPAARTDDRTPAQRRADALTDICRLASACGELPDNGGDRPVVIVTTHYNTLTQELGTATLDTGQRLPPSAVRRLACDAKILPAVLNTHGQVLDLGRERRLFTGPIRRALVLRDQGCAFPGCDRPPRFCSAHHTTPWAKGGTTDLAHGVLLCHYHHHVIHQNHWKVHIAPDGHPEFTPPEWIDAQQRPQRNYRAPP